MSATEFPSQALEPILTDEERRQRFRELGWLVSIPVVIVPAHWLYERDQRLDGGYYAQEAVSALRLVSDSGFEVKPLGELVETPTYPGRFKRIYAKSSKDGMPFLTASETLQFRSTSQKFLAKSSEADSCAVQQDWLLVSRSGTVGRCVIVGARLSQFAITDDAIRIPPKTTPIGYIYAYLSTWIGQALLVKDWYGAAIKHLEPQHLMHIPVPQLPDNAQQAIHAEVIRARTLRDEANELLDEADELLHEQLGLPRFDKSLVPYFSVPALSHATRPEIPPPEVFCTRMSELNNRLDASYHVPVAKTAKKLLYHGNYKPSKLSNLVRSPGDIFVPPRFKRVYVQSSYGIPLLQGAHISQMKPYGLKYLSRTQQRGIARWLVRKGWILVTCSGTIGRVGLVSSYQHEWAASQHLLRIIPDYSKGHPGYIAAFLMTPYGQHQLASKIYGGVVDELTAEDTREILIPDSPLDIQKAIGERVVRAFEKKDEATAIEEEAIRQLEIVLQSATP